MEEKLKTVLGNLEKIKILRQTEVTDHEDENGVYPVHSFDVEISEQITTILDETILLQKQILLELDSYLSV